MSNKITKILNRMENFQSLCKIGDEVAKILEKTGTKMEFIHGKTPKNTEPVYDGPYVRISQKGRKHYLYISLGYDNDKMFISRCVKNEKDPDDMEMCLFYIDTNEFLQLYREGEITDYILASFIINAFEMDAFNQYDFERMFTHENR